MSWLFKRDGCECGNRRITLRLDEHSNFNVDKKAGLWPTMVTGFCPTCKKEYVYHFADGAVTRKVKPLPSEEGR